MMSVIYPDIQIWATTARRVRGRFGRGEERFGGPPKGGGGEFQPGRGEVRWAAPRAGPGPFGRPKGGRT